MRCLNCQLEVEGNYCSNCGQRKSVHRFSVMAVLHDIPHSLFHVEKGIFKNIVGIRNPNKTIREYLEGHRIAYYSPFLFFLISSALVIFFENLMHKENALSIPVTFNKDVFDGGAFISHNLKYIYLGAIFLYAIPSWLLFKKESRFNYAEHVIANLFMLGWANCIYLLLIFIPSDAVFPLSPIMFASVGLLTLFTFKGNHWWLTALKALLIVVLQIVLFLLLAVVAAVTKVVLINASAIFGF